MVTSDQHMLQPRGLAPALLGLQCQLRGDWSQRIASFTSESDSNTFAGSVICHTMFSVSLWTMMTSVFIHECPWRQSQKTGAIIVARCVCFIILLLALCQIFLSPDNGSSKGRWPKADVGVHSCISTNTNSTLSQLLYSASVTLYETILFFLTCKLEDDIAGRHLLLLYSLSLESLARNGGVWRLICSIQHNLSPDRLRSSLEKIGQGRKKM